jgi:phage shock protein A
VRYDAVNAMLLNEFLKQHLKVEQLKKDLESKIAEQEKQIEALTAGLQKMSTQLAAASPSRGGLKASSKPVAKVVNNPQQFRLTR